MIATLEDIDLQSEFGSRVSGIKLEIEQRSVRICGTARSQYIKQLLQQRLADRYGSVRIRMRSLSFLIDGQPDNLTVLTCSHRIKLANENHGEWYESIGRTGCWP